MQRKNAGRERRIASAAGIRFTSGQVLSRADRWRLTAQIVVQGHKQLVIRPTADRQLSFAAPIKVHDIERSSHDHLHIPARPVQLVFLLIDEQLRPVRRQADANEIVPRFGVKALPSHPLRFFLLHEKRLPLPISQKRRSPCPPASACGMLRRSSVLKARILICRRSLRD
jgi:hypothetical protein